MEHQPVFSASLWKGSRKVVGQRGKIEGVGIWLMGSPSSLAFVLIPLALELNERLSLLKNSVQSERERLRKARAGVGRRHAVLSS